ncbi:MAG: sulfatase-like hydrolase/transferase, partial [Bacteroidales bacterium]|nr:sulfatase-like hydrolase/transferase [Bacteroidales bacterium]
MKRLISLSLGLLAGAAAVQGAEPKVPRKAKAQPKMNVLFIMSDDMRTDWKVYGTPQMHTPNLDALAGRGVL